MLVGLTSLLTTTVAAGKSAPFVTTAQLILNVAAILWREVYEWLVGPYVYTRNTSMDHLGLLDFGPNQGLEVFDLT